MINPIPNPRTLLLQQMIMFLIPRDAPPPTDDALPEHRLHLRDGRYGAHARAHEADEGDGGIGGVQDVADVGCGCCSVGGVEEVELLAVGLDQIRLVKLPTRRRYRIGQEINARIPSSVNHSLRPYIHLLYPPTLLPMRHREHRLSTREEFRGEGRELDGEIGVRRHVLWRVYVARDVVHVFGPVLPGAVYVGHRFVGLRRGEGLE